MPFCVPDSYIIVAGFSVVFGFLARGPLHSCLQPKRVQHSHTNLRTASRHRITHKTRYINMDPGQHYNLQIIGCVPDLHSRSSLVMADTYSAATQQSQGHCLNQRYWINFHPASLFRAAVCASGSSIWSNSPHSLQPSWSRRKRDLPAPNPIFPRSPRFWLQCPA